MPGCVITPVPAGPLRDLSIPWPYLMALAGVANLSVYHFSRLFKKTTGATPMSYVRNFRLEKAVHFLANTNLSVSEIAYFRHVGSYLNTG